MQISIKICKSEYENAAVTEKSFDAASITMYSMQATTFPLVSHMIQVNRVSESAAHCYEDRQKAILSTFKCWLINQLFMWLICSDLCWLILSACDWQTVSLSSKQVLLITFSIIFILIITLESQVWGKTTFWLLEIFGNDMITFFIFTHATLPNTLHENGAEIQTQNK